MKVDLVCTHPTVLETQNESRLLGECYIDEERLSALAKVYNRLLALGGLLPRAHAQRGNVIVVVVVHKKWPDLDLCAP